MGRSITNDAGGFFRGSWGPIRSFEMHFSFPETKTILKNDLGFREREMQHDELCDERLELTEKFADLETERDQANEEADKQRLIAEEAGVRFKSLLGAQKNPSGIFDPKIQ